MTERQVRPVGDIEFKLCLLVAAVDASDALKLSFLVCSAVVDNARSLALKWALVRSTHGIS